MSIHMLNTAVSAARAAGDLILRYWDRLETVQFSEKQKNDYVTEVDKHSEELIIEALKKNYPTHSILAEESGETPGDEYLWIIDPLDGTNNFIHGIPHFCVSIALQIKGRLEQAVIYDPIRQELFTASRGHGAKLGQRRMRVSKHEKLDGALLGTGYPYREDQSIESYLATLAVVLPQTAGLRRGGAAALDLAYVAAGRFDGFWEFGLSPWDIAAGALLIKESGGLISDFDAAESYLQNGDVIAGNPKVFKELIKTLQKALKK